MCLSTFQLYAYATTADGYAPEYPLPLLFKVEDDTDNAPYFENKVTIFSNISVVKQGPELKEEKWLGSEGISSGELFSFCDALGWEIHCT